MTDGIIKNNSTLKKKFNWFLLIRLLGIGLFIYILTRIDLRSVWENIKTVAVGYLLWAIVFQIVLLFIKAIRWHVLNDGRKETSHIYYSFGAFFESYAIGVITPGRLGELVKAGHKKSRHSIVDSGFRVLIERGFDIGIFLLIAGLSVYFSDFVDLKPSWGIIIATIGILVIFFSLLVLTSAKATGFLNRIFSMFPFVKRKIKLLFTRRSALEKITIVGLSVAGNLFYFVSCYFLALGIDMNASFIMISGGVAIAGFFNMLPITVMGLGTRETTFLYVFQLFPKPLIMAFSGLIFFVAQIGGGLISLVLGQLFLFISKK